MITKLNSLTWNVTPNLVQPLMVHFANLHINAFWKESACHWHQILFISHLGLHFLQILESNFWSVLFWRVRGGLNWLRTWTVRLHTELLSLYILFLLSSKDFFYTLDFKCLKIWFHKSRQSQDEPWVRVNPNFQLKDINQLVCTK